jgi:hypothetical protein
MPKEKTDIPVPATIASANVKRAGVLPPVPPSAKPPTAKFKSTGVPPINRRGRK